MRPLFVLAPIAVLAACATGQSVGEYTPFSSRDDVTSDLLIVGAVSNSAVPELVATGDGTFEHASEAIEVTINGTRFSDQDGPDREGGLFSFPVYRDGNRSMTLLVVSGDPGTGDNFEYVGLFGIEGTDATTETAGVIGIATQSADVPSGGSITYTGFASVVANTGGNGIDADALSTVAANFGTGAVNVTINSFSNIEDDAGQPASLPFDTMSVTGMSIAGNRFSGGSISFEQNGGSVSPIGTPGVVLAEGGFFGFDDDVNGPDEAAGLIAASNAATSDNIVGVFFAD